MLANKKAATFYPIFLIPIFVLFLIHNLKAQDKNDEEEFKINFQIKPRAEVRNGAFTPLLTNQTAASFISQRTRIGFLYKKKDKLKVGVTLQNVSAWGNDPQVQISGNGLILFEAWAEVPVSNSSNFKVGRQVFSYDDERILGALDWNQAGRKHDAVLFQHQKGNFTAHLALAYNQNSEKINSSFFNEDFSQPYKSLQFAWLKFKISETFSLTSLLLNQQKQRSVDSAISSLQTFGVNTYYTTKKTALTTSIYYQTGKSVINAVNSQNTRAWLASIYGTHQLNTKWGIGLGTDYLSGMDMGTTTGNNSSFNPLYGTHHKFYGYMDYFYVGNGHKNTGLWDNYISINLKSSPKTNYQLTLHHFTSPAKILNNQNIEVSSFLGNEFDLTFNHEINKAIKLVGGYSQMFLGNSMRYIKNISDPQQIKSNQSWMWLSLIVTPEFKLK